MYVFFYFVMVYTQHSSLLLVLILPINFIWMSSRNENIWLIIDGDEYSDLRPLIPSQAGDKCIVLVCMCYFHFVIN